ncbi:MAG: MBL fold metallo-hydrolase [Ruminococcaceae bacterium]|nr:MBL fold metallo-hydrolase [Oscillospiraceae bacterium]
MRVISLYSGSSGNCTLIEAGEHTVLLDAGGSAKALIAALESVGSTIHRVTDIFITHEHGDHTHALSTLLKKHPCRVHMTEQSANAMNIQKNSILDTCLIRHGAEFTYDVGELHIEAFPVPHDSHACVGYRFTYLGTSVGIVTDIGYVTQTVYDCLCGCEAVIIEANHDREMVRCGNYPAALKSRILSGGGHLSNDDCAEISGAWARQGTKKLMLAHLSEENNTPDIALETVKKSTDPYGVDVCAAKRDEPTVLLESNDNI